MKSITSRAIKNKVSRIWSSNYLIISENGLLNNNPISVLKWTGDLAGELGQEIVLEYVISGAAQSLGASSGLADMLRSLSWFI